MSTEEQNEQMRKRAREVADALKGSCKSLHNFATDEEMQDAAFCAELDSHVFCCGSCEWWSGNDEMSSHSDDECDACAGDDWDHYESEGDDEDED